MPAPADSLRWAIEQTLTSTGPHTIVFAVSGTILLADTLPQLTEPLTIDATGRRITIDGNDKFQILSSTLSAGLTLRSLTLTRGNCNDVASASPSLSPACQVDGSSLGGAAIDAQGGLILENSTIASNQGTYGAVTIRGALATSAIVNSTIVNNRTGVDAAVSVGNRDVQIVNSTFADNVNGMPSRGASLSNGRNHPVQLSNSLFSGASRPLCWFAPGEKGDIPLQDMGGNLSEDASCAFTQPTSLANTLAQLGPLQDNGGDTFTMLPFTGSPAIDQGINTLAVAAPGSTPLLTDQRGAPRISPAGGQVDRGAVEVTPPPTCSATASPAVLWSPNHKLVDIALSVTRSAGSTWTLKSVTSSEADAGLGTDDVPADVQAWSLGSADSAGRLRAERYSTAGRIYTLTAEVRNVLGATGTCQAQVTVPYSQRK